MKTLSRVLILVSAATLLFRGGVFVDATHAGEFQSHPVAITTTPLPLEAERPGGETLPFTFDQVVTVIGQCFELQPVARSSNHALFRLHEQEASGRSVEQLQIEVTAIGNQLAVAFAFREWNATHHIGEFFESRLFTRWESEHLYALLYDQPNSGRWTAFGRFRAWITTHEGMFRTYITLRLALGGGT